MLSARTTSSGSCHFAKCCARCASTESRAGVPPCFGTTISSGRSSHFGWRTPIAADGGNATGGEPAVGIVCRALVDPEVRAADPGPPNLELTGRDAVPGELAVLLVDDLHVDPEHGATLQGALAPGLLARFVAV